MPAGLRWLWLLWSGTVAAGAIQLQLDDLHYGPFSLTQARGWLTPHGYELTVRRIDLPFPPQVVRSVRLTCPQLQSPPWRCPDGDLEAQLPRLRQRIHSKYRWRHGGEESELLLDPLRFAGAVWRLAWKRQGRRWQARLETERQPLAASWLRPLFSPHLSWLRAISGQLRLRAVVAGSDERTEITASLTGRNIDFHDEAFDRVGERVGFDLKLNARRRGNLWQGKLSARLNRGELLHLPIYLSLDRFPIALSGDFSRSPGILRLSGLQVIQNDLAELRATLSITDDATLAQAKARFQLHLPHWFQWYVQPLLEGGNWEGLMVNQGTGRGEVSIAKRRPERAALAIADLILSDRERRLGFRRLEASLRWRRRLNAPGQAFPTSWIRWQAGHLYAVPLGPAQLILRLTDDDVRLLSPAVIPVLDGRLRITQLQLLDLIGIPKVVFSGKLETVSLELLTRVLGLPPLAGTLSGIIPQVTYDPSRRTLQFHGRLVIQVFDGRILVENLTITDLFGALPRLRADVFFHDLDLELLTRHFAFGKITGRLEGHIRNLYLENWRPVSFDAWFGTPAGDRSRKRINQKAVENLADLGGGGAMGLLSRVVLRFFDEFSYRRIGLGCRLRRNVCELRGVAPAPNGFYIVQGGGLPRIDVIGYNRRIDWPTLLARLARITQIDHTVDSP